MPGSTKSYKVSNCQKTHCETCYIIVVNNLYYSVSSSQRNILWCIDIYHLTTIVVIECQVLIFLGIKNKII